jgi:hypothetical protein
MEFPECEIFFIDQFGGKPDIGVRVSVAGFSRLRIGMGGCRLPVAGYELRQAGDRPKRLYEQVSAGHPRPSRAPPTLPHVARDRRPKGDGGRYISLIFNYLI